MTSRAEIASSPSIVSLIVAVRNESVLAIGKGNSTYLISVAETEGRTRLSAEAATPVSST